MSEPLISLLHPTVRPKAWKVTANNWLQSCDHPENVEYVLVPERVQFPNLNDLKTPFERQVIAYNENRASTVGGSNYAAQVSHGKILFVIADDFYSAPHWDTDLLRLLNGKLDQEAVVWASTGISNFDENFISLPILTRPYYQRLGNYVFWPEYTSYYADVEFHEVAKLNKVEMIDARNILKFSHIRGGIDGSYPFHTDEHYIKNGGPEGVACGTLFGKRQAAGFPR